MPLKVEITREIPELTSLDAKDKLRFIKYVNLIYDKMEELSRRAQEAGIIAERVQENQQMIINNLGSPSITAKQDSVLGSIGNLSSDITNKTIGAVPVGGTITVKDNLNNTVEVLIK